MSRDSDLKSIRESIDNLDKDILRLLSSRASLAQEAGKAKFTKEKYKPDRESLILNSIVENNKGPLSNEQITSIYKEIISSCRATEEDLDIAFLGPEGTYSDEALIGNFGSSVNKNSVETIEDVFRKVQDKKSDYGIVPIENSTEGSINITLDCLTSTNLKICGEMKMKIHHNLLGHNKSLPAKGYEIHAHEQSLAQCKTWLDSHCPDVKRVAVASNAIAAKEAAESQKIYAIAGELASKKYGLDLIRRNIEDYSGNTTRFISLGFNEVGPTGKDKTSLMIKTKNETGALYKVLSPVEKNKLNLTHITYRPSKIDNWQYIFFLDIEGHKDDSGFESLFAALDNLDIELRVLGSFPQALS